MDLYIYYRVQPRHAATLRTRIDALQSAFCREYGIRSTLKRSAKTVDGKETWMEIYLAVPDGFETAMQQAVRQTEVAGMIEGERHIEYFSEF